MGLICYLSLIRSVQYVSLKVSCGFTVQVTKPIEEGEELFANYGSDYFKKGECLCDSYIE